MIIYACLKGDQVVYIGQTKLSLAERKGKHVSESRLGRGSVLGAGIRKHGEDKFTWKVLMKVENQEEACDKEKMLIAELKPQYNQQQGGKKGFKPWNKGKKENRSEVIENIAKSAQKRLSPKRGSYSTEHKDKIGNATLIRSQKAFICLNNQKVYYNKVTCAKDLGIDPRGISLVLMPNTRLKTYKGFSFKYVNCSSAG